MGILDKFENGVERVVNNAFARAFRSEVKPIELADGEHTLRFEHSYFQPVDRKVVIEGGSAEDAQRVSIDFVRDKVPMLPGKTVPVTEVTP